MSKASKRRAARLAKLAARANGDVPVQGNMLDRMQALARTGGDQRYDDHGWRTVNGRSEYNPAYNRHLSEGWSTRPIGYSHNVASDSARPFYVSRPKDTETFHCASAEIEGKCPIMEVPEIHIEAELWDTFITLADSCDTEWIALLLGNFDAAANVWRVTGHYYPPQQATGTSVDIPSKVLPKPGTIGALHSHVKMQAFFSGTDKAHSNWPIEIVINARGEYAALARFQLKCGGWTKQDSKVLLENVQDPQGWAELRRAFAQGARIAKGKQIAEDSSPEPATVQSQTAEVAGKDGSASGDGGRTEHVPDDGSAAADGPVPVQTDCPDCGGIGLVDAHIEGELAIYGLPETEICKRCNGWAKLVDGKPISAAAPKDLVC